MISIIICSKYEELPETLVKNIADTINVAYEIIHIVNANKQYSIFSAYNEGFRKSQYPNLCFLHDDVKFHSYNWGQKLVTHLEDKNAGVFGLAGRDIVTRVPASWKVKLPSVNIIQSSINTHKRTKVRYKPKNYIGNKRSVVLLDGVMLCMRRELMSKIKFDEQFNGFHGYDFDICIQAATLGFENYVMYDIVLEHFSRGNPDEVYYKNLIAIFKKWQHKLPIVGANVSENQKNKLYKIEKRGISRLLHKMARRNFSVAEISAEILYFAKSINVANIGLLKVCIPFEILLIRLLNFPLKIKR